MENKLRPQTVDITFASPGARPPVYVAGSFTSPEWVPQEMEYALDKEYEPSSRNDLNYLFSKRFDLLPGRYSYKFRLGDGDWWVCDQKMKQQLIAPPAEDSSGNLNNCLVVKDPDPDPDPDPEQAGAEAERKSNDPEKLAIPEKVAQIPPIIEGGEGHDLVKEPLSPSHSERMSESTIQVQDVHQPLLPEDSHGGARRRLVGDHSSSVAQFFAVVEGNEFWGHRNMHSGETEDWFWVIGTNPMNSSEMVSNLVAFSLAAFCSSLGRPLRSVLSNEEVAEVPLPKVRIPGPNSWANEKAALRKMKIDNDGRGHAVSRDRLDHKPMPPTPETSPSEKTMTVQKKKGYIQPATPLVKSNQRGRNVQRAVTDPVVPQPLFASANSDATQLRKKRSQANLNPKASKEEVTMPSRSGSPAPVFSEKASKILGVLPTKDYRHVGPPVSAPPSTKTPDPFRGSTEDTEDRGVSPSRQVQSTPVPTRRYMRENNLQTPTFNFAFPETEVSNADRQQIETRGNLPVFGDAMGQGGPQFSKLGSCGRLGEVKYVNQNLMQRVPSFAGIIENACQPYLPEAIQDEQQHAPTGTNTNEQNVHPQSSAEILKPVAYSPGNLAGVWENDPHVGYSLPPFSPLHQTYVSNPPSHSEIHSHSHKVVPIVLRRFNGESSHGSGHVPSLHSANSWAQSSHETSSQSGSSHSTAGPSGSSGHGNAVPPPPHHFPGFQPHGQVPPSLVRMEMNLHHHVDSCFNTLFRMTTENTDKIMDQVVRRLEDMQDTFQKALKTMKGDIREVKRDVGHAMADIAKIGQGVEGNNKLIQAREEKLSKLEMKLEDVGLRCQQLALNAELARNETRYQTPRQMSPQKSPQRSPERRSEVDHSASVCNGPRQQTRSGATRLSEGARQSANSNQSHQSDAAGRNTATRISDERSARREYFAELGAARGPMPDLREHPAFAASQQDLPSFSETWYQRAYGTEK
ncbi:MAG: hypothetical protein Q9167_000920 [Letrouitia subvulpina]